MGGSEKSSNFVGKWCLYTYIYRQLLTHLLFNIKHKLKNTMKPTHIEHLGIAVTSLEDAMPFFEFLTGEKCYPIE